MALFAARAPERCEVVLDDEHDRFEWVGLEDAVARCLPAQVGAGIDGAARSLRREGVHPR